MRLLPFLLAFGLAAGSFGGPMLPGSRLPAEEGAVTLSAAPSFSGILRPGQALQVMGSVTNTAGQTMDAGTAFVYLGNDSFTNRASLTDWLTPKDGEAYARKSTELGSILIGELAPGQIRSFTITVPADSLNLNSASLSTLPLTIQLSTSGIELDEVRSAVVWSPVTVAPIVNVAVAMPLITPPGAVGLLDAAELASLTSPDGELSRQLVAATNHQLALGVDPMILASIRALGTSAPPSALEWLIKLSATPNDTFALSYADADLALAHQAGAKLPLEPTSFPLDENLFAPKTDSPAPTGTPTEDSAPPLPSAESLLAWDYTLTGIGWPADNSVVAKDLAAFNSAGFSRTILNSLQISGPLAASQNVTLDDQAATVSDDSISRFLRAASIAASETEWNAAVSSLAAELAVAASTHNNGYIFATFDRSGSAQGSRLEATLDTLEALPWVSPSTMQSLIAVAPATAKFVDSAEPATRVATVKGLLASEANLVSFSSVLDEPQLLSGPRRLALLAVISQSWHANQAGWNAAATEYRSGNTEFVNAVYLPDISTINLLQEKGNLPIAVTNDLGFPVTVYVSVQPDRAILDVLDRRVELKIEANSQAKASIPVQSIANGEVQTQVRLTSRTNVTISNPTIVELNVQAGWETAATVVLAVLVVVMFVAGVLRTIARRRKRKNSPREVSS